MEPIEFERKILDSSDLSSGKNKRFGWLSVLRRIVAAGIVLVVLFYIIHAISSNWIELKNSMKQVSVSWIILQAFAVLSYFALLPVLWGRVIHTGETSAPLNAIIISGYLPSLGKYVPGKIWSVASRIVLLNRYSQVPRIQAVTATYLQYIFELAGAAPYVLGYALLGIMPLISVGKTAPAVILSVIVAIFPGAAWRFVSAILLRMGRKINSNLMGPMFTPGVYLLFIFQWAIYGFSGIALCRAFGHFDSLTAAGIGCAFIASWLIGFISLLTPGGIGVREGAMVLMLTPLIGNGTAVLVSVIARLMWTIGDGCGILTGLYFTMKAGKNIHKI